MTTFHHPGCGRYLIYLFAYHSLQSAAEANTHHVTPEYIPMRRPCQTVYDDKGYNGPTQQSCRIVKLVLHPDSSHNHDVSAVFQPFLFHYQTALRVVCKQVQLTARPRLFSFRFLFVCLDTVGMEWLVRRDWQGYGPIARASANTQDNIYFKARICLQVVLIVVNISSRRDHHGKLHFLIYVVG